MAVDTDVLCGWELCLVLVAFPVVASCVLGWRLLKLGSSDACLVLCSLGRPRRDAEEQRQRQPTAVPDDRPEDVARDD